MKDNAHQDLEKFLKCSPRLEAGNRFGEKAKTNSSNACQAGHNTGA